MEGLTEAIWEYHKLKKEYTIASQEFTIYGKITAFLASSLDDPENVKNEITRINLKQIIVLVK